jgi:peroxiredoxin
VSPPASPPDRDYRWIIGILGLVLVVAISIYQFASHGIGTTGVPPGHRLRYFAAPLAASTLNGDPNLNPPCTLARHDPRALNICLLVRRVPLVLAFFVTGSKDCQRQVDALQALSGEFPATAVQFAAVAVDATHSTAAALVRAHRWTIPVAYDRDGAVGAWYGVEICPMVELANRGGTVKERLIGDRWLTAAALAPAVRALLGPGAAGGRRRPAGGGTT